MISLVRIGPVGAANAARSRFAAVSRAAAGALLLAGSSIAPAFAAWEVNMPRGVTDLSEKIYDLHMLIFWVCVAIAVAVFSAMVYSIVRFRKSRGVEADKSLTHSTRVEIVWTVIPVAILVLMAVPAARTLIDIEDTRNTELTIKVTGYQWKWHYDYLDAGVSYFSTLSREADAARQLGSGADVGRIENYLLDVDNPLVVPAGRKVRLLVTANDVIHAWWVPEFGMKKDAIPGFVNEMWIRVRPERIGTYRGQCTELCGRDHAFMPIEVEVKSPRDYDAWLKRKQAEAKTAALPSGPAETGGEPTVGAGESGTPPARANLARAN